MKIIDERKNEIGNIGVVGLGYVGLQLFLELSKKINVIGYDKNAEKVKQLREEYLDRNIVMRIDELKNCDCYIVAVPTPINDKLLPDLSCVVEATKEISLILKRGDVVIYESTVFPGTTENICKNIIEESTGMIYNKDFYLGYSPERINPGDNIHNLSNTPKIVSGSTENITKLIESIYQLIIEKTYVVSNIKTAEAIKLLENTQRDVNIALMNEFSLICSKENIDIYEVINGANTKWNFYKCYPGLVGGHCIGVDPYYYIYYAKELNEKCDLVEKARNTNENIKKVVTDKISNAVEEVYNRKARILIVGLTYKPNVADTRNSKIIEIIKTLDINKYDVFAVDDVVNAEEMQKNGIKLVDIDKVTDLDLIVFATVHNKYKELPYEYFENMFKDKVRIIEIGNFYKEYFEKYSDFYWNL